MSTIVLITIIIAFVGVLLYAIKEFSSIKV